MVTICNTIILLYYYLHFLTQTGISKLPTPTLQAFRLYSAGPEPLELSAIESRVLTLLSEFDKVKRESLSLDAHFVTELGLDSLDQVEITMALEDEFTIEISDEDAEKIYTPRQAVEIVIKSVNIRFTATRMQSKREIYGCYSTRASVSLTPQILGLIKWIKMRLKS